LVADVLMIDRHFSNQPTTSLQTSICSRVTVNDRSVFGCVTSRFVYSRRRAAAIGAFGGISFVTFLAAAGCFLIGCCGSPMLPIYISIFGAQAAGAGKLLMALISLISIGGGYLCVRRTACHCADPKTCPFPEKSSTAGGQNSSPVQTDLGQKQTV
jgi:hypothetical protein